MTFWAPAVVGWIVLWFRPDWRWLLALAIAVALPTTIFIMIFALQQGVGLRSAIITNAGPYFPLHVAYFAIPGAAIVALRRFMLRSEKNKPSPPR